MTGLLHEDEDGAPYPPNAQQWIEGFPELTTRHGLIAEMIRNDVVRLVFFRGAQRMRSMIRQLRICCQHKGSSCCGPEAYGDLAPLALNLLYRHERLTIQRIESRIECKRTRAELAGAFRNVWKNAAARIGQDVKYGKYDTRQ